MRVCFHLRVRPERIEDYKRLHRAVWPEMLAELKAAGVRDYSIWMWRDGHEFGVLVCDDWEKSRAYLAGSAVARRWEESMREYLETPVEGEGPELLEEIFRLE